MIINKIYSKNFAPYWQPYLWVFSWAIFTYFFKKNKTKLKKMVLSQLTIKQQVIIYNLCGKQFQLHKI